MALERLGNLTDPSEMGEKKYFAGADNLGMKIFFDPNRKHFIPNGLLIEPDIENLPEHVTMMGAFDANFLGKILNPTFPVVILEGVIGSGKTTTIHHLLYNVLQKMNCKGCDAENKVCNTERLIAHLDFRRFINGYGSDDGDVRKLIMDVCNELAGRASRLVTKEFEYFNYWKYLIETYDNHKDHALDKVTNVLLREAPWIRNNLTGNKDPSFERRNLVFERLRENDVDWYLRYLVVLWRYIIKVRFFEHKGCALVILDNVDSLQPNLQRKLLDIVLRSSHRNGPTFLLLLRPETRKRHGLADTFVDSLIHNGPKPIDVVRFRLDQYLQNPDDYYQDTGLSKPQKTLLKEYLANVRPRIDEPPFENFINNAAGKSIRVAEILAQYIVWEEESELREKRNSHYLIRTCITDGNKQYNSHQKNVISNLFDVANMDRGRLLLKVRILRYIKNHESCGLNQIRSAFTLFDYDVDNIKTALNDLMRLECQLIVSNGMDLYEETWGDEMDILYLTDIGKGYIDYLIYDTDFLQEVMLDARVDTRDWPQIITRDNLNLKLILLFRFLRNIKFDEILEINAFKERHGISKYKDLFGSELITRDIITKVHQTVTKIIRSSAARYPHFADEYNETLSYFTSLKQEIDVLNDEIMREEQNNI